MRKFYDLGICLSIVSIALFTGCGAAEPNEQIAESTAALSRDFQDSSGQVIIRIKQCPWSGYSEHNTVNCTVDSDFVLIGGGAEIQNKGNPGALLTASYPADSSLTTWTASSKDDKYVYSHYLRAYAIGLKLIDNNGIAINPMTIRNSYMQWVHTPGTYSAEHPSSSAELRSNMLLLGGGVRGNGSPSYGQYLVSSYPDSIQWYASTKDQIYPDVETVDAYAIGITSGYIANFGYLNTYTLTAQNSTQSNYVTTFEGLISGYALAAMGGDSQYNNPNAGRILTQLIPYCDTAYTVPGATVTSKDHGYGDSGVTTAYVTGIKKQ